MVWIASLLHELSHRLGTVVLVEVRQQRQSLDYLICTFVDDLDDVFDINFTEALVLGQVLVGIDRFGVHDLLSVDCDDLISENSSQDRCKLGKNVLILVALQSILEAYLEVGLQEASGGGDDRCLEWAGNADVCQELDDVRSQTERNWPR